MKVTLIAALAGVAASSPVTTPPSTASTSGTKIVPWVVPGNYATPEKLTVGETITFKCAGMDHNIWQVSKAGYDGCTATDATTSTFWGGCDDGETKVIPASALKEGTTYFICTEGGNDEAKINGEDEPRTGGHCLAGQKMEVIVSAAGASHPSAGGLIPPHTPPPPPMRATRCMPPQQQWVRSPPCLWKSCMTCWATLTSKWLIKS